VCPVHGSSDPFRHCLLSAGVKRLGVPGSRLIRSVPSLPGSPTPGLERAGDIGWLWLFSCVVCGREPTLSARAVDSAGWVEVVRAQHGGPVVCRAGATLGRALVVVALPPSDQRWGCFNRFRPSRLGRTPGHCWLGPLMARAGMSWLLLLTAFMACCGVASASDGAFPLSGI
jgi:hypothetical protein